ncbi:MAG: RIP metalloprotease RseP [Bryobacterales bacterium]|nr:RIP metalloprotease RseP [Bryobacterales bacterium]MBV9397723.1 RIP metalloprotease RseP [Bryobacterales bacterium]
MISLLQNIWWYLVLIGVMILIHELGHYWAARFFDVKVETFSFGFGPRLFGFRRGETDFRFSAILFGGYVKMSGDQPGDEAASDPRSLFAKPRWQRTIIAFAGPAINMVLAVALLTGLFMFEFPKVPMPRDPIVGFVMPDGAAEKAGIRDGDQVVQINDKADPNWEDIALTEVASAQRAMDVWVLRNGQRLHFTVTPQYDNKQDVGYAGWFQETEVQVSGFFNGIDTAQKAGIQKGDILVSVNGNPIRSTSRMRDLIDEAKGAPVNLVFSRNGARHEISITPAHKEVDGQERWMIGVELQPRFEVVKLPLPQALAEASKTSAQNAKLIFSVLEGIVERRMSPKSFAGPIRIAQMSGQAAREGAATFIGLMAAVSLNLAIVNLMPIPILDGGVILMLLVEMLLRRDLDLKVKEAVIKVGFVFLMVVLVFAIYNDISKILPPG